jgi:hypothetical protein
MQNLSAQSTWFILSLPCASKRLSANPLLQRETRFKPLFCLWGSKVPQEQKQALRKRLAWNYLYKFALLSKGWQNVTL